MAQDRRRSGGAQAGRRPRPKAPKGRSHVGERHEVTVGPIAHGGHCVARVALADQQGGTAQRVVFVRHALPGERVIVAITEGTEGDRFWRGDAVEILQASPDRVTAPCPYAGPGLCGGCDFQHVALSAQRGLKAAVVREQLTRLAGLDLPVVVEPVPNPGRDDDGLRWRTRQAYAPVPGDAQARGMRKHRSHEVVPVDDCRIAATDAREPAPGIIVEAVTAAGESHEFEVAADGFWQVHPSAPRVLVETVLDFLAPQAGESVLDLYAGVGLFAAFLADRVGEGARVVAVEGEPHASALSTRNVPGLEAVPGDVVEALAARGEETFDLVVLDPPREGARRAVVEQIAARSPRAVAYVACDPAALARDLATFAEHGYGLRELRAFDLFPMTHHVECVALLTKSGSDLR